MIKINKKVKLIYWTNNNSNKNLGDYIGELMLKLSGISISDHGFTSYFTVGTVLSNYWFEKIKDKKIFWGSGSCGYDFPNLLNSEILAVRGPLTRDWLSLNKNIPLGDPALLFPRIYLPKKTSYGPYLIENYHNNLNIPFTKTNIVKKTSMKLINDEWETVIDKIANSEFILANSLHSSILAHAYGTPWSFFGNVNNSIMNLRWLDWFSYLGLPAEAFYSILSLDDGIIWWQKYKDILKKNIPISNLIDACPWNSLRQIIK